MKLSKPIIKKELYTVKDNFWVLSFITLFITFTLALGYINPKATQPHIFIQMVIPILCLSLGYPAIVTEVESGTIQMVLSKPISRFEFFFSKYLTHFGIILGTTTITYIGLWILGANIGALYASTTLLTLCFLSISYFISTFSNTQRQAFHASIGVYLLFTFIWSAVLSSVLYYQIGQAITTITSRPLWYQALTVLNPVGAFSYINTTNPFNPVIPVISLSIWLLLPLLLSIQKFKTMDL